MSELYIVKEDGSKIFLGTIVSLDFFPDDPLYFERTQSKDTGGEYEGTLWST